MSGGQHYRRDCSCQETDHVFGVRTVFCIVHEHYDHEGMTCEQAEAEWALDRLEKIANGPEVSKMPLKNWFGYLNYYVLQWFFVRLARVYDDADRPVGWKMLWGIVPATGWTNDYRYVWGFAPKK